MIRYLDVAMKAINAAQHAALEYYGKNPEIRAKEDKSPVTTGDIEAEKAAIAVIKKHYPDHAVYGEESGHRHTASQYTWLIDPIDGTRNYIARIPLWGNLIALMYGNEVILGVSNVPLLHDRLWAVKGEGAFLNGEPVHVSDRARLRDSMISYGSLSGFAKIHREDEVLKLVHATARHRSFGDLWPYHLLASGRLDIVAEAQIKAVDVAPFVCIIREAGGEVSDLNGDPFDLGITSFLATNGQLHGKAQRYFRVHA